MNRDDLILQTLVADSIQFGNISPSALFPAREQGLTNLKMIAGSFNGTTYSIIALPKFKTLEQLKGAKLAVSSLQAGSIQVLKYILKQKGLIYPRDSSQFPPPCQTYRRADWVLFAGHVKSHHI